MSLFPFALLARGYARARLTSKQGNKDYFKGKGGGRLGRHTKHGGFILDPKRMREFVVPDLASCQLRPYVSHETGKLDVRTMTVDRYIEEALTFNKTA